MDASSLSTAEKWDYIYSSLGITDFMNFLNSELQYSLLPLKIFFILFSILFFCLVVYFYINSSYLKYRFTRNVSELISGQEAGLSKINAQWIKIIKKTESGGEQNFKLAIVQADDLMLQTLKDRGFQGKDFEELIANVDKKIIPNYEDILEAHEIRNNIVYDLDYKLDLERAKKMLNDYQDAIRNIAV